MRGGCARSPRATRAGSAEVPSDPQESIPLADTRDDSEWANARAGRRGLCNES